MINQSMIKFLTMRRIFIFLDEWLSYFILYNLWASAYYYLFGVSVVLAIVFNGYAYYGYWKLENKYNDYLVKLINKE
tara:strand:+ start:218 stop:448 length:231 start_codon:yes stop_codon:yes gene_type:complete